MKLKKSAILFVTLLLSSFTVGAQSLMNVEMKDGTHHTFLVDEVEKVTFSEDQTSVDLGLSVKWASCNIGAQAPEEYGSYFAFEETSAKEEYSDSTYEFWTGVGMGDMPDFAGDKNYDAATANLGNEWRMPTTEEAQELKERCTWEYYELNGVAGAKVTGPNGNSIFLPAAGHIFVKRHLDEGISAGYWFSSPCRRGQYCVPQLNFGLNTYSQSMGMISVNTYFSVTDGYPVRAVKP